MSNGRRVTIILNSKIEKRLRASQAEKIKTEVANHSLSKEINIALADYYGVNISNDY
jgi:hypothetical protein